MSSCRSLSLPVRVGIIIIDFLSLVTRSSVAIFFHFTHNLLCCFLIGFEFFRFVRCMIFLNLHLKGISGFFLMINSLFLPEPNPLRAPLSFI